MADLPVSGSCGLLYHSRFDTEILVYRSRLGHVEVMADAFLDRPSSWQSLARVARFLPVTAHAVGLSLGSAEGPDPSYVKRLARFLDFLRPAWIGEHLSFVHAGGRRLGNFAPLPRNRESLAVLRRNLAAVTPDLPCPMLLENVAAFFALPEDEWDEAAFLARVADATGCGLLLDLHNLYVNAGNLGFDASQAMRRLPLDRVREVHLAGGVRFGRWLVDTHTRPVPEAVFGLLAELRALGVSAPVTLEWDAEFPRFERMLDDLERARAEAPPPARAAHSVRDPKTVAAAPVRNVAALGAIQSSIMAAALDGASLSGVAPEAVEQFRRSLARKEARRRACRHGS